MSPPPLAKQTLYHFHAPRRDRLPFRLLRLLLSLPVFLLAFLVLGLVAFSFQSPQKSTSPFLPEAQEGLAYAPWSWPPNELSLRWQGDSYGHEWILLSSRQRQAGVLDRATLMEIFRGNIRNWQDLGQEDQAINLLVPSLESLESQDQSAERLQGQLRLYQFYGLPPNLTRIPRLPPGDLARRIDLVPGTLALVPRFWLAGSMEFFQVIPVRSQSLWIAQETPFQSVLEEDQWKDLLNLGRLGPQDSPRLFLVDTLDRDLPYQGPGFPVYLATAPPQRGFRPLDLELRTWTNLQLDARVRQERRLIPLASWWWIPTLNSLLLGLTLLALALPAAFLVALVRARQENNRILERTIMALEALPPLVPALSGLALQSLVPGLPPMVTALVMGTLLVFPRLLNQARELFEPWNRELILEAQCLGASEQDLLRFMILPLMLRELRAVLANQGLRIWSETTLFLILLDIPLLNTALWEQWTSPENWQQSFFGILLILGSTYLIFRLNPREGWMISIWIFPTKA